MPNWCYCELSIVGPIEERLRFKDFAEGSGCILDFNKFIPYPERFQIMDRTTKKLRAAGKSYKDIPKDGFNSGGYEWCIKNWGTKWNACSGEVVERPRSLFYMFDTAWSPPRPVVRRMAGMFPNLRFNLRYWEQGIGFQGQLMIKNYRILKAWEDKL